MTSATVAVEFPTAASTILLYFSISSSVRGVYSLVVLPSSSSVTLYVPSTTIETEIPLMVDGDLMRRAIVLLIS